MRIRLSKTIIDAVAPGNKEKTLWDMDAPGLGLRIRPSGKMTFIYQYRKGVGRKSQTGKLTIGAADKITADDARKLAKKYAAQVANGEDPAAIKANRRDAPTVEELYREWMGEMTVNPRVHQRFVERANWERRDREAKRAAIQNARGAKDWLLVDSMSGKSGAFT